MEVLMEDTEKQIVRLIQSRSSGDFVPIRVVALNAMNMIEKASKTSGTVTGIPTGFIDLDYKLAGMHPAPYFDCGKTFYG